MDGSRGSLQETQADVVRVLQGQGNSDVIEVPQGFLAQEAVELLPGVLVGKLLGEGMAVRSRPFMP